MSDPYYFSVCLDNKKVLCIGPLSNRRLESSGQEVKDVSGYFLFETDDTEEPASTKLLARLLSEEAAIALSEMLRME
jgi:hypothetical protein